MKKPERKKDKEEKKKELPNFKRDKYPDNYKVMNEVKMEIDDISLKFEDLKKYQRDKTSLQERMQTKAENSQNLIN